MMRELNIWYFTDKRINFFFSSMQFFSVLHYIWLIEWGFVLFLIKIKLSNSMHYSMFLLFSSIINHNNTFYIDRWDVISVSTPIYIIFSYITLLEFKLNFFRFHSLYSFFIAFNIYLKKLKKFYDSFTETLPNKIYDLYYYQMMVLKYFEVDFKSLVFIVLPLSNYKYFFSFIFYRWMNYWNNRVYNWKYIT
jgi:hypothetical protein